MLKLIDRLNIAGKKLDENPTEVYWLAVPAVAATAISAGMGDAPRVNTTRKEMAHDASVYLRSQAGDETLDEMAVKTQIDALRNSFYYDGGNASFVPGENHHHFTSSEIQSTVNPLESMMAKSHTDGQLRTEIQAASVRLDDLAKGIRTNYSPEISVVTAAVLYCAILAAYGIRKFVGSRSPNPYMASRS